MQSLPPDKEKDKKKSDKGAAPKRPGAEVYQRKITGMSAQATPVSEDIIRKQMIILF